MPGNAGIDAGAGIGAGTAAGSLGTTGGALRVAHALSSMAANSREVKLARWIKLDSMICG